MYFKPHRIVLFHGNENQFRFMRNEIIYSLCEAVADIAFIAAKNNYQTEDSREMISQFIQWAKEFEYIHRNVEWGVNFLPEYIDSIYHFTIFKINQWNNV